MIYQKMLLDQQPYFINSAEGIEKFEKHRHPEIEFNYCIQGEYTVIIDNEERVLKQGDLIIIGSMTAHEFPGEYKPDCRVLVIEVGPVLFSGYFDLLANITTQNPILRVDENNNKELLDMFMEIIALRKSAVNFAELAVKGNLYKICAYILREFKTISPSEQVANEIHLIANIEKALELIENRYNNILTVEEVAGICGYSKSNFCKIFRRITGDTFHNTLNKYRIKMACNLLKKTNYSVEVVACEVGFADVKTFCRVFKSIKGITAGEYRKEKGKDQD